MWKVGREVYILSVYKLKSLQSENGLLRQSLFPQNGSIYCI